MSTRLRARNCRDVAALLGLCEGPRTMEEAKCEIQVFYEEHGCRPRGVDMNALSCWFRVRGTTLRKVCDEMGLPGRKGFDRTMGEARQEITEFYQVHGRRPHQKDGRALVRLQSWLCKRGSSVSKLCDEIGLPGWHRTENSTRQEIKQFFKEHGHRPRYLDMRYAGEWLSRRGHSIEQFCDDLALPDFKPIPSSSRRLGREILEIEKFVAHGCRPYPGMPAAPEGRRSIVTVHRKVLEFFKTYRRRPFQLDLVKEAKWLTKRQLPLWKLCDEIGLPKPSRKPTRTEEDAVRAVRAHVERYGTRPSAKRGRLTDPQERQMKALDMWLRKRGKSLSQLCDGLGFPKKRRGANCPEVVARPSRFSHSQLCKGPA